MYASGSSPPPHDMEAPVPTLVSTTVTPTLGLSSDVVNNLSGPASRLSLPPTTHARKRKRGQAASTSHAASPAPSEPGSTNGTATGNDTLLASRADLYSRPQLSIARGPTFIPISEGSEWFRTDGIGVNRVGFRYVPAGINPPGSIAPCRTIESNPTSFRVSWEDRSPHIRVSKDGLGLAGFRGFRSARFNAPIREGKWYMEVKIVNGGGDRLDTLEAAKAKEGNHVRLGWGRREASLNGPVGLDGYTYGYRDKTGDKVTLSRPRPYGKPFKSGDVIGMYISLPPLRQPKKKDPHDPAHIHRERIPIDFKGQEYFELLEYPVAKEMSSLMDYSGKPNNSASVPSTNTKKAAAAGAKPPDRTVAPTNTTTKPNDPPLRSLPTLPGSTIAFFVNGESQGVAFEDIYDFLPLRQTEEQKRKAKDRGKRAREGVKEHRDNPFDDGTLGYYPMISLFNDAIVRVNPGPHFDYPPPVDIDALLEGKPQPAPAPPTQSKAEASDSMNVDLPVKSEPEPVSLEMKMDTDEKNFCWKAVIDRYPEFMKEQWALDAIEEEEAKVEFDKQIKGETAKGRKKSAASRTQSADTKKPAATKANKKKKASGEGAETPEPTPAPKKAKKAAGQAALGVASTSAQPTPGPEASNTRSATETPFGTPPPPSVSSTAAAAAAAAVHLHFQQHAHPPNPHQFHHALARSESASNRPSPSPLRQSTAYRGEPQNEGVKTERMTEGASGEEPSGLMPSSSNSAFASQQSAQPRPKKHPPGSQRGRQHAQQAAAAAAASVTAFPTPVTTPVVTPQRAPPASHSGSLRPSGHSPSSSHPPSSHLARPPVSTRDSGWNEIDDEISRAALGGATPGRESSHAAETPASIYEDEDRTEPGQGDQDDAHSSPDYHDHQREGTMTTPEGSPEPNDGNNSDDDDGYDEDPQTTDAEMETAGYENETDEGENEARMEVEPPQQAMGRTQSPPFLT